MATPPHIIDTSDYAALRARLGRTANVLDSAIRIPGTRIRFGLDAVIGLIPGVGDVAGVVLGLWMLFQARTVQAPATLQRKMLGNLAIEGVIGLIPVLGDIFDVYWQANQRNRILLVNWLDEQQAVPPINTSKRIPLLPILVGSALLLGVLGLLTQLR